MNDSVLFINELLKIDDDVLELYKEHLNDFDTLIPHVFMGELTRYIVKNIESTNKKEVILKILKQIDIGLNNGNNELKSLIYASFIENLLGIDLELNYLKDLMPSLLRNEVDKLLEPRPAPLNR